MDVAEFEAIENETEKQFLETWSAVEAGTMDVEEAEKMLIEKMEKED